MPSHYIVSSDRSETPGFADKITDTAMQLKVSDLGYAYEQPEYTSLIDREKARVQVETVSCNSMSGSPMCSVSAR